MAQKKTSVVLIQGKDGQIRRVRVDGNEFAVMSAGPTMMNGEIGVVMTLTGVEVSGEAAPDESNAA